MKDVKDICSHVCLSQVDHPISSQTKAGPGRQGFCHGNFDRLLNCVRVDLKILVFGFINCAIAVAWLLKGTVSASPTRKQQVPRRVSD